MQGWSVRIHYTLMIILFRFYWHKLKTLNYITKLIMFSHNGVVIRKYITAKNNYMLTGFERYFNTDDKILPPVRNFDFWSGTFIIEPTVFFVFFVSKYLMVIFSRRQYHYYYDRADKFSDTKKILQNFIITKKRRKLYFLLVKFILEN